MAQDALAGDDTVAQSGSQWTNFFTRNLTDGWTFEFISTLFGTILIILLCVLLREYDGQPVPSFGSVLNTDITLNFAVSLTLSVAIPALMFPVAECVGQLKWYWFARAPKPLDHLVTFDEASRGIAGGATFLWKMRARPFASVGAFLAIFQLIVGPLTQNALLYPLEAFQDPHSANAKTPVVRSWSDTNGEQLVTSLESPSDISIEMIGAIQRGIFTVGPKLHPLPPSCSTGNCTIGPYRTMGVCSSSANVTPSLTESKLKHPTRLRLSLPGGASLLYKDPGSRAQMKLVSAVGSSSEFARPNVESPRPLHFSDSIAFKDVAHPIADIFLIYLNQTQLNSPSSGGAAPHPTPAAIEFVLEWCVQTLQSTMENGTATTKVLGDYRNFTNPASASDTLEARPPPASSDPYNQYYAKNIYSVGTDTHSNYQHYFQTLLDGTVTNRVDFYNRNTWIGSSDVLSAFFHPFNPGSLDLGGKSHITDQEGLDTLLTNLATSMTNQMRGSFPPTFRGVASRQRTIVTVQWPFLIAPIIFTALCILFFAGTLTFQRFATTASAQSSSATTSGQQKMPIRAWKSSSLAVLRGLEPDLQERLGAMTGLSELQQQAQQTTVVLRPTDDGYEGVRLVEVEKESGNSAAESSPSDRGSYTEDRSIAINQSGVSEMKR